MQRLVKDLNLIYREQPALHATDSDASGFRWVVQDDRDNSVYAFVREKPGSPMVLIVANMTPVTRSGYRLGVPQAGRWREILNSDSTFYGGSGVGNGGHVDTVDAPSHGHSNSLELTLPPLAALIFVPAG